MATAVRCACVLTYRGFHTDTEAFYGVGDRVHINRPEITGPVVSVRLFEAIE